MRKHSMSQAEALLVTFYVFAAAAGAILGLPGRYTHHTISPQAKALFLPAGVAMLVHALVLVRRRSRAASGWVLLLGLAAIGVGLRQLVGGPWALLALPFCVLAALFNLRAAFRGTGDRWFDYLKAQRSPRAASLKARSLCLFVALLAGTFAVMAVSSASSP